MYESVTRLDGLCTYWQGAVSYSADALRQQISGVHSTAADLLPASQDSAALRRTLNAKYPDHLIRPLARKEGFDVVEEILGSSEHGNHYSSRGTARPNGSTLDVTGICYPMAYELTQMYQEQRALFTGAQVGMFLSRVCQESLGGVALRENGGFYWLPGHQVQVWSAIDDACANAAHKGRHRVYYIRHSLDPDSVIAVMDALRASVSADLANLSDDIQNGGLGKRGMESKQREAGILLQRVREYERMTGTYLNDLTSQIEGVEEAAAEAVLMCHAKAEAAV